MVLGRLRFILGGVVLALAGVAAILYFTFRSSAPAPASAAPPVSDTPAATWPTGALRAPGFRLRRCAAAR